MKPLRVALLTLALLLTLTACATGRPSYRQGGADLVVENTTGHDVTVRGCRYNACDRVLRVTAMAPPTRGALPPHLTDGPLSFALDVFAGGVHRLDQTEVVRAGARVRLVLRYPWALSYFEVR